MCCVLASCSLHGPVRACALTYFVRAWVAQGDVLSKDLVFVEHRREQRHRCSDGRGVRESFIDLKDGAG